MRLPFGLPDSGASGSCRIPFVSISWAALACCGLMMFARSGNTPTAPTTSASLREMIMMCLQKLNVWNFNG